jgi:hypothetical protein
MNRGRPTIPSEGPNLMIRRRDRARGALRNAAPAAALALGLAGLPGCGTTRTTSTARTGTEQLLLTNAWDKALMKVDFRALTGVPVYLDATNATAVDQGWVVSSLREAMLTQGVLLREKREAAQYIVEARVGAYGTNDDEFLLGIKQTTIPATVTGVPTGTIPELPLVKRSRQEAVAKLALFAYDRASGQLVWSSGNVLDKADNKDVYVGGFGPINSSSIREGTEVAGIKIPMPGEAPAEDAEPGRKGRRRRKGQPYDVPAARTPAPLSDLDSFRPDDP